MCGAGRAWKLSGSVMLPAVVGGGERGLGTPSSCSGHRAGSYQHQLCRGSHPAYSHFVSFPHHQRASPLASLLLLPPPCPRLGEAMAAWTVPESTALPPPLSSSPPAFSSSSLCLPLSLLNMPRALSCVLLSQPPTKRLSLRCTQREGEIGPALPFTHSPCATLGQPCGDPYCPWQYLVGRCASFKVASGQPVWAVVFINWRGCAGCGISVPKDATNTVVH